jgi:hypothetical protein
MPFNLVCKTDEMRRPRTFLPTIMEEPPPPTKKKPVGREAIRYANKYRQVILTGGNKLHVGRFSPAHASASLCPPTSLAVIFNCTPTIQTLYPLLLTIVTGVNSLTFFVSICCRRSEYVASICTAG